MFSERRYGRIADAMGMSMSSLVDENIAVKIQRKIDLERPPEFTWLSSFEPTGEKDSDEELKENGAVFSEKTFKYEKGRARQNYFDEEENKRKTNKIIVIRDTDKETRVRVEFELDKRPEVHMLLIENEDQEKPAGGFMVKKTLKRWKSNHLDSAGKKYGWGRSLASIAHPVKKNRFGDWRKIKANGISSNGTRSQSLTRLDMMYMRSGLFLPVETDDWETNGLQIMMPSDKTFSEIKKEFGEEWMCEHLKFSKDEINKRKRENR